MAKGPESLLHQKVKENLPKSIITRLESRVGLGIPDCLVGLIGQRFVMIELKVVKSGRKVKMSPHQIAFNLSHGREGLPVFILVLHRKTGTTKASDAKLLLYHGSQSQELYDQGVDAEPLAWWPYDDVDWHEMRHNLLK